MGGTGGEGWAGELELGNVGRGVGDVASPAGRCLATTEGRDA